MLIRLLVVVLLLGLFLRQVGVDLNGDLHSKKVSKRYLAARKGARKAKCTAASSLQ